MKFKAMHITRTYLINAKDFPTIKEAMEKEQTAGAEFIWKIESSGLFFGVSIAADDPHLIGRLRAIIIETGNLL